jgi:hypothetical protein
MGGEREREREREVNMVTFNRCLVDTFFRVTKVFYTKKKAVLKFTFLFARPKNPTQTRITASAISPRVKFGGRERRLPAPSASQRFIFILYVIDQLFSTLNLT